MGGWECCHNRQPEEKVYTYHSAANGDNNFLSCFVIDDKMTWLKGPLGVELKLDFVFLAKVQKLDHGLHIAELVGLDFSLRKTVGVGLRTKKCGFDEGSSPVSCNTQAPSNQRRPWRISSSRPRFLPASWWSHPAPGVSSCARNRTPAS